MKSGATAIVVSNHGGRVLDHTLGTADVLREITAEFKDNIKIIVDVVSVLVMMWLKCLHLEPIQF